MKKYEVHEAANIFPLMEGEQFKSFVEDIREHGQSEPIYLYDGKIIDGRNRLRACKEIGVEPYTEDIDKKVYPNPLDLALSLNLKRRHLSETQMSMCATKAGKLWEKYSKEGAANMKAGQARGGATAGRGRPKANSSDICRAQSYVGKVSGHTPRTSDKVGAVFGVSGSSVDRAKKILRYGSPEVIEAVENGELSAYRAAQIVNLPKNKQAIAMKSAPRAPTIKQRKAGPEAVKGWAQKLLGGADRRTEIVLKAKWSEKDRQFLLKYISPACEVLQEWEEYLTKKR